MGPLDALKKHANTAHAQDPPQYPAFDTPNICECTVAFFKATEHNPDMHILAIRGRNPAFDQWQEQVRLAQEAYERALAEYNAMNSDDAPCARQCPHSPDSWNGGFCRVCMTRAPTGGWHCKQCDRTGIKPPEPHFYTGTQTRPRQPVRSCPPQTEIVISYNCDFCGFEGATRYETSQHLWQSHVQGRAVCTYGNSQCSWSARRLAESPGTYIDHCNSVHSANLYR